MNSYVVSSMLTHDPVEIKDRNGDPLIARPIGAKMLLSVLEEGQRLIQEAAEISVPTLVLSADRDWVVRLSAERDFFKRLGATKKEMVVYSGFVHEVFHEKDRQRPIAKAREFIQSLFEISK
jgi:alpha-beta hydrolase superfamily lysophospholipase